MEEKVNNLFNIYLKSLDDILKNYTNLYNESELNEVLLWYFEINYLKYEVDKVDLISKIEQSLKPFISRVWMYELENNLKLISWLKNDKLDGKKTVVFSSLVDLNDIKTFCNARIGIEYDIEEQAIIGALNKDGATLIEDKKNFYTLDTIKDKNINSYNRATSVITPSVVMDSDSYNEVILNSKYIKPKRIVYLNNSEESVATTLANFMVIPCDKINIKQKKQN